MVKKSKRLQPVVRIARSNEQDAARQVAEWRSMLNQQERQLSELLRYQEEYTKRFHDALYKGTSATQARDFRVFLHRLEEGIAKQREQLHSTELELQRRAQHWDETKNRSSNLDKIRRRYETEERRCQDKREQMESDDNTAIRHVRGQMIGD